MRDRQSKAYGLEGQGALTCPRNWASTCQHRQVGGKVWGSRGEYRSSRVPIWLLYMGIISLLDKLCTTVGNDVGLAPFPHNRTKMVDRLFPSSQFDTCCHDLGAISDLYIQRFELSLFLSLQHKSSWGPPTLTEPQCRYYIYEWTVGGGGWGVISLHHLHTVCLWMQNVLIILYQRLFMQLPGDN